jgi:hypothetical protein
MYCDASALCATGNQAVLKPTEERSGETEAREAERWERPNEGAPRGKGDGGDLALYRACTRHYAIDLVAEVRSR